MCPLSLRPAHWLPHSLLFVATALLAACGSTPAVYKQQSFETNTPFSENVQGSPDVVCWSVKRALLSQGYMLNDQSADSVTLTGTKDFQRDNKTNVTIRLQTSCADNKNGSSTVFATATSEVRKLQYVKQSVTAGVSIATFTVPAGSEKVLEPVKRETITDPKFYQRFYRLVESYVGEDERGAVSSPLRPRRFDQ